MEDDGKKINRREFMGQIGISMTALGAFSARPLFAAGNRVLQANDRIRVGLIGAGDRGQKDLKHLLKQPNVECVAIADVYSRRCEEVKAYLPEVATYDDPRRLLDRNDIDAVINATPLHLHSKYFQMALAAGKDLYSEKTMTWNIPEAVACRKASKESKQVVQIGIQDETSGELADAKKWIQTGLTGKITMVEAWQSRNTPPGHAQWVRPIPTDCNPDHVNWDLFLNDRPKNAFDGNRFINWRLFWEFSGGNITENMVHQIAWIVTALDLQLPKSVNMMGGVYYWKDGRQVPDIIGVSLEYDDLLVTWRSTFTNGHYGLGEQFLGVNGTIEHLNAHGLSVGHPLADDDENAPGPIYFYPEKATNANGVVLTGENPGVDHMANWLDSIRNRKQPNASVEMGYLSAIACHMANLSFKQQRRISLEEAMAAPAEAWM
jgi:predicted dehydrogenase